MGQIDALLDWLEYVSSPNRIWFAKRLSANDTGQTESNQAGFYLPQSVALDVAPELAAEVPRPKKDLRFNLVSHDQRSTPTLTYYNSQIIERRANGRNEFRVTGFGGRRSALQDPASTGGLLFVTFDGTSGEASAWLAETLEEEDEIESVTGPVEPGVPIFRLAGANGTPVLAVAPSASCTPAMDDLPAAWAAKFPKGGELTDLAVAKVPGREWTPDRRLVERYRCEYGIFRVVEASHTMPLIKEGFATVDDFLAVAQKVANRRKSRAGRSLELHLAHVFDEERVAYDRNKSTEGKRKPDFVFPSIDAYQAGSSTKMLAVKTTVKERWRQVLDEAARIKEKHLFTLSEGVSQDQFDEMTGRGIQLVVPSQNFRAFPKTVRARLMTLEAFVEAVR